MLMKLILDFGKLRYQLNLILLRFNRNFLDTYLQQHTLILSTGTFRHFRNPLTIDGRDQLDIYSFEECIVRLRSNSNYLV